jgi:hypothetical protein
MAQNLRQGIGPYFGRSPGTGGKRSQPYLVFI